MLSIRTCVAELKPWPLMVTKTPPPVPVVVGVIVVACKVNVRVLIAEVIRAKPLLAMLTLNEYVQTGFCP